MDASSYPLYRRSNDGRSFIVNGKLCDNRIVPDSPRYKASGKPIPYNRRFVSISGTLTDVIYKDPTAPDPDIDHFVVTVEEIVFWGSKLTRRHRERF
jgi:hypothetical protein